MTTFFLKCDDNGNHDIDVTQCKSNGKKITLQEPLDKFGILQTSVYGGLAYWKQLFLKRECLEEPFSVVWRQERSKSQLRLQSTAPLLQDLKTDLEQTTF